MIKFTKTTLKISNKALGIGALALGGAIGGAAVGTPGLKRKAAMDAAVTSTVAGLGGMAAWKHKGKLAKMATDKGRVVFRMVRGRLRVFRVKS